jgi:hypothetical protein
MKKTFFQLIIFALTMVYCQETVAGVPVIKNNGDAKYTIQTGDRTMVIDSNG